MLYVDVHLTGKRHTVGIEGNNCRLRHRMRRIFQKSCKQGGKAMTKLLAAITAASALLLARWVFITTAGFNRELDLIDTIIVVIFLVPLALAIKFSVIRLLRGGINPEGAVSKAPAIAVSVMVSLSMAITFVPFLRPGSAGYFIHADSIRPTDDGLFEYRLELVNVFHRNASARLFIRDLNTGDEMHIPIDLLDRRLGGLGIPGGINFMWGRMEKDREAEQYILSIPVDRAFQQTRINGVRFQYGRLPVVGGAFLIDMETKTAAELYRIAANRTSLRIVRDEDGQFRYQYSLGLFDTLKDGKRVDTEVLLTIGMTEPQRTYDIFLPISAELLENDNLRRRESDPSVAIWITLEQTDIPERFIMQTTSELSDDITLRFLIDTPSLTATRIND